MDTYVWTCDPGQRVILPLCCWYKYVLLMILLFFNITWQIHICNSRRACELRNKAWQGGRVEASWEGISAWRKFSFGAKTDG